MLRGKISLFISLSVSFSFIIFMSFLLSIGIDYLNTSRRLPYLLTEVQSGNMAHSLSLLYSRQGNWSNLASVVRDLSTPSPGSGEMPDFRVIVEDREGKTLFNSFSELLDSSSTGLIEGKSEILTDYISGEAVGRITLYVNEPYLKRKTAAYLVSASKDRFFLTLGAVVMALIPAALLSRRLSAPLARLSKASREIRSGNIVQISETGSNAETAELIRSFNGMSGTLKKQKELRQRLIGDLSHEINTPLNIIDLEARGILDGLINSGEGLGSIRAEIDKLTGLVKDLEWLAETDAGEICLNRVPCSLSRLIEEERERWQYKADKAGIRLTYRNGADHLPPLMLDPLRVRQVISNLLENSLKYAPGSEEIAIRLFGDQGRVHVSVSDQGPGIPPEETDEIFERLYRLDSSRNGQTGGRGLGLSIVKSIMEMHLGEVRVESRPGKGSTFILTFPLEEPLR